MAVALSLTWVIYSRQAASVMLVHGIMTILCFLVSILALLWALKVRASLKTGEQANPLMTVAVFLLSLIFTGYNSVATLFVFFFRYFHYSYMLSTFSDQAAWKSTFEGWSFADA
jgi:hypothetical protein